MQVENKKKLQHEPSGMYWCECRMLILFMKCNPKHKILLGTLCFSYSEIKRDSRLSAKYLREKFVFIIMPVTIRVSVAVVYEVGKKNLV